MQRYRRYLVEEKIKVGDTVNWTYIHHLNSRATTFITKSGKVVRLVKSTVKGAGYSADKYIYAMVHFRGNKNPSRIKISELKKDMSNG